MDEQVRRRMIFFLIIRGIRKITMELRNSDNSGIVIVFSSGFSPSMVFVLTIWRNQ